MIKFLFLFLFSFNVFSLNSHIDKSSYSVNMTNLYSNSYPLSNCFDGSYSTYCISNKGSIEITFNETVNIKDFHFFNHSTTAYPTNIYINNNLTTLSTSYSEVSSIKLTSVNNSLLYLSEIYFNFGVGDFQNNTGGSTFNNFSNFFNTEEEGAIVWALLVGLMLSVFGLGYIARIIKNGGDK